MDTPVNPSFPQTASSDDDQAIENDPNNAAPNFASWLSSNIGPLLAVFGLIALILWKGLNVVDIAKVLIGLGLVIFIHELGHFVAAKWCDVHVEMFAIGFGQPLPGCQFKYGETTYKIGWIPLGGFVKMIGEGENADTEEAEEDPRSFKNKSVGQRMLIISAGVIMNMILAVICFMIAYSHGIEERSPVIGWVESGSPAWKSGLTSETTLIQIDSIRKPMFDDLRPRVMGSDEGEKIPFIVQSPVGEQLTVEIEPQRDETALFPTIGVAPAKRPVLIKSKQRTIRPFFFGTAASKANPPFLPGDRIIGCSADRNDLTPKPLPNDPNQTLVYAELYRRMYNLRGLPITMQVERAEGDEVVSIQVPPAFTKTTGMRMEMGRITAIRGRSPAVDAIPIGGKSTEKGFKTKDPRNPGSGDKIIEVEVVDGQDSKKWTIKSTTSLEALDPLRLPFDLEQWFEKPRTNQKVRLTVLRPTGHSEERVTLETQWDDKAKYNRELVASPNAPLSIPSLGIAYQVEAVVESVEPGSSAEKAGIHKGDLIKEIRFRDVDDRDQIRETKWQEVRPHQWAAFFQLLQNNAAPEFDVKIQRGTGEPIEFQLTLQDDDKWPTVEPGLRFQDDTRLQKADDLGETIGLGLHRTWRTVKVIYQNLYAMINNRVSPLTMSGPLTIASVSYNIAGENLWQFILFLGMINVNLAIINFLPIPILDGGHMVFLIYEKIRGKPAPDWVQIVALWIGLACILGLMFFVLFLDVQRMFF